MKNDFHNKNGDISMYGFACGYVQKKECSTTGNKVQLFVDGCIHVQSFNYVRRDEIRQNGFDDWNAQNGWRTWESFDNNELTKARKFYKQQIKKMGLK